MSQDPFIATMATRTLRVGPRQFFLAEAGQGPAVLMLHGGGPGASGLSNYSRNVEALSRHFRVLVPDMQGYGRSTKGLDRRDPFGDLADGMLGLLDTLGIAQAHVLGNSLGGACALRMALEQPAKVDRLVLMGPGGINTSRSLPTRGLRLLMNYYSGTGPSLERMRTFIRGYLVHDGQAVPEPLIAQRYAASIEPELLQHGSLLKPRGLPRLRKLDFTRDPRLSALRHRTLVLWGTEDKVNRPSGGLALQRRLPHCDLYLFSQTGHWVQWERAEEFNAVVSAFLLNATAPHSTH